MQHDSAPLVNAYAAIEDLLREVQGYVKVQFMYGSYSICMYMYMCIWLCMYVRACMLWISFLHITTICFICVPSLSLSLSFSSSSSLFPSFLPFLLPQVWLQYQSLWDMESGNIYGRLDTDLARWQKLLMDVKYVVNCLFLFQAFN